jgi:hypothetical protein
MKFDLDQLVSDCRDAIRQDPLAVRRSERTLEAEGDVSDLP